MATKSETKSYTFKSSTFTSREGNLAGHSSHQDEYALSGHARASDGLTARKSGLIQSQAHQSSEIIESGSDGATAVQKSVSEIGAGSGRDLAAQAINDSSFLKTCIWLLVFFVTLCAIIVLAVLLGSKKDNELSHETNLQNGSLEKAHSIPYWKNETGNIFETTEQYPPYQTHSGLDNVQTTNDEISTESEFEDVNEIQIQDNSEEWIDVTKATFIEQGHTPSSSYEEVTYGNEEIVVDQIHENVVYDPNIAFDTTTAKEDYKEDTIENVLKTTKPLHGTRKNISKQKEESVYNIHQHIESSTSSSLANEQEASTLDYSEAFYEEVNRTKETKPSHRIIQNTTYTEEISVDNDSKPKEGVHYIYHDVGTSNSSSLVNKQEVSTVGHDEESSFIDLNRTKEVKPVRVLNSSTYEEEITVEDKPDEEKAFNIYRDLKTSNMSDAGKNLHLGGTDTLVTHGTIKVNRTRITTPSNETDHTIHDHYRVVKPSRQSGGSVTYEEYTEFDERNNSAVANTINMVYDQKDVTVPDGHHGGHEALVEKHETLGREYASDEITEFSRTRVVKPSRQSGGSVAYEEYTEFDERNNSAVDNTINMAYDPEDVTVPDGHHGGHEALVEKHETLGREYASDEITELSRTRVMKPSRQSGGSVAYEEYTEFDERNNSAVDNTINMAYDPEDVTVPDGHHGGHEALVEKHETLGREYASDEITELSRTRVMKPSRQSGGSVAYEEYTEFDERNNSAVDNTINMAYVPEDVTVPDGHHGGHEALVEKHETLGREYASDEITEFSRTRVVKPSRQSGGSVAYEEYTEFDERNNSAVDNTINMAYDPDAYTTPSLPNPTIYKEILDEGTAGDDISKHEDDKILSMIGNRKILNMSVSAVLNANAKIRGDDAAEVKTQKPIVTHKITKYNETSDEEEIEVETIVKFNKTRTNKTSSPERMISQEKNQTLPSHKIETQLGRPQVSTHEKQPLRNVAFEAGQSLSQTSGQQEYPTGTHHASYNVSKTLTSSAMNDKLQPEGTTKQSSMNHLIQPKTQPMSSISNASSTWSILKSGQSIVRDKLKHQCPSQTKVCETNSCKKSASRVVSYIDFNIDPCDDFYSFSCKGYEDGNFKEIDEKQEVYNQIKDAGFQDEDPYVKKFKKLFDSCVYFNKSENLEFAGNIIKNLLFLKPEDENEDKATLLADLIGDILLLGPYRSTSRLMPIFDLRVELSSNGTYVPMLTLPSDESLATRLYSYDGYEENCFKKIVLLEEHKMDLKLLHQEYIECLQDDELYLENLKESLVQLKVFDHLPEFNKSQLLTKNLTDYTFEVSYLLGILDKKNYLKHLQAEEQQETYMTLDQLKETYPLINWTRLFERLFHERGVRVDRVRVMFKEILAGIFEFYDNKNFEDIRFFTVIMLAHDMYSDISTTKRECSREEYCLKVASNLMDDVAAKILLSKYDEYNLTKIEEHISDIFHITKTSFNESLEAAAWLTSEQKTILTTKLDKICLSIGSMNFYFNDATIAYRNDNLELTELFAENLNILKTTRRSVMYGNFLQTTGSKWLYKYNSLNTEPVTLLDAQTIVVPAGFIMKYGKSLLAYTLKYEIYATVGYQISKAIMSFFCLNYFKSSLPELDYQFNELTKDQEIIPNRFDFNISDENINMTTNSRFIENTAISLAFTSYIERNITEYQLPWINFTIPQLFYLFTVQDNCYRYKDEVKTGIELLESYGLPKHFQFNSMMMNSINFAKVYECPKNSPMNPEVKMKIFSYSKSPLSYN